MNSTLSLITLAVLSLAAICYLSNLLYKACIIIEHLEEEIRRLKGGR